MDSQRRIEVYARQRKLIAPILDNIGIRANIAFWNVGHKLTSRQRRRYLKAKNHFCRNPPF